MNFLIQLINYILLKKKVKYLSYYRLRHDVYQALGENITKVRTSRRKLALLFGRKSKLILRQKLIIIKCNIGLILNYTRDKKNIHTRENLYFRRTVDESWFVNNNTISTDLNYSPLLESNKEKEHNKYDARLRFKVHKLINSFIDMA